MSDSCILCNKLKSSLEEISFIRNLGCSSFFLNYNQRYLGRSMVVLNKHVEDIADLQLDIQRSFWEDLMMVHRVIMMTFHPVRINLALLGNKVSHLHWHLIPRYQDEININLPPWPQEIRILNDTGFLEIKNRVLKSLEVQCGEEH